MASAGGKREATMATISEIFSAQVPRYTSYPTAPHFHDGVNGTVYRDWLARLNPDEPLSLYLHIPFCDTLCFFCGCHTSVVNHYGPVRDYCGLLEREIALVAPMPAWLPVQHIHWGGGSPTLLEPDDIARLTAAIRAAFNIRPDAEFAVEVDPRGLSRQTVQALAKGGLTRASIGVQDCNIEVQQAINRVQTKEQTITAMEMLRAAGVASINLDLIYGLPKQTLPGWQQTLDFVAQLEPDRVAVFGYAHVPKFKKHQALIPQSLLPGLEERFRMAELARNFLSGCGYVPIGMDHYAKPGDSLARALESGALARNFQGYTADPVRTLIGLGASSIGSLPQGYVQNVANVPAYRALLAENKLPVARGFRLGKVDRVYREIIETLMCTLKVDLDTVARRYGVSKAIFADAMKILEPMRIEGLVSVEGNQILMEKAWPSAVRLAASAFDQYLPRNSAAHSSSI
jgi:oxygen-independent coproporphyrinogen-3 oxidase